MNLNKRDKTLIIVAVIICIAIAVFAPFIASSNPDGLEKSAEDVGVPENTEFAAVSSPMPDYTFEPLGVLGEIGALVVGILIVLVLGFGIGYVLKKRN